jgi:hypothetical protein
VDDLAQRHGATLTGAERKENPTLPRRLSLLDGSCVGSLVQYLDLTTILACLRFEGDIMNDTPALVVMAATVPAIGSRHLPLLLAGQARPRRNGHCLTARPELAGQRPTLALDKAIANHYPFLVREGLKRNAEFIAHGLTRRQIVGMSEDEES